MTRRLPFPSLLVCLLSLAASPSQAAVEVTDFNGSITDVGVQRGPGQVGGVEFRIRGELALDQPLDLSRAVVRLQHLFFEDGAGGASELIKTIDDADVVPLVLPARDNARETNAVFESPPGYRPHIRLQVQVRRGVVDFRLKLDRGLTRQRPALCADDPLGRDLPTTLMTHAFSIEDGVNAPLDVVTVQRWECTKPDRYHMRSRPGQGTPPPPPPTPGPTRTPGPTAAPTPTVAPPSGDNEAPQASLRANLLEGDAGVRNLVELDASGSSDDDGTVVRYRFESGDGRVQDGSDPVARFVYPPGDHRAALQVFDDRGAASEVATRGFSVR
jgi:hypothetical protein